MGHSVGFDIGFLEEALGDGTRIESGTYLDTLVVAREGYPDLESYKLGTLSNFFGVELTASHRALPDAEATANLLLWFAKDLPARIDALGEGIATAVRAAKGDAAESAKLLEAARRNARVSKSLFGLVQKKTVRKLVLAEGVRMDGRATDEIRPISIEVGVLPRAHGSGLFTRGQTQVLTVATLGASSDEQRIDTIGLETEKRYIHHYNFPPYSAGETADARPVPARHRPRRARRARADPGAAEPGRVPVRDPRRVRGRRRNGSTSMASTCGSTLALMDAGVPIKAPVAGVAMGLVLDGDDRQLRGPHRHPRHGGRARRHGLQGHRHATGITALQMDIKVKGIDERVIREGLKQARDARLFILDKMNEVIAVGARGDVRLRAAHHHDQDQPREDPRDHRPGRQDDPQDPRRDQDRDRHRGRRHRGDRPSTPRTRARPSTGSSA